MGRPVRRRTRLTRWRRCPLSVHFDWRLAPLRPRRLPGPRPGAAPGRPARRRRAEPDARRPRRARRRRRVRGVPARRRGRGRPHRPGARPDRAGRPRTRRQAARRPLAATTRSPRSAGCTCATTRVRSRPGRSTLERRAGRRRPRRTSTRRCPAARTCSTPSRCCSPTTCWRTSWPLVPRRRAAAGLGRARRRLAVRRRRAGRLVARPRPGGRGRRTRLRARRRANSIDGTRLARLRGRVRLRRRDDRRSTCRGSPRRSIIWATREFGFVDARRRLLHRLLDHAAEEEPGHRRAGPGQVRAADRQPDRAAGHAQGRCRSPTTATCRRTRSRSSTPSTRCRSCCPPSPAWSRR